MKSSLILAGILLIGSTIQAQDTTRKKEVNITSTFKPTLKEAAKINLNATPPTPDTTRPRLQYTIPNQNLAFAFQPGSLKPLALQVDTGGRWDNESFAKIGYGNYKTPFLQLGLSAGDGKTAGVNLYAKHISSKGKLQYQDYTNTNIGLNAFFQTANNLEYAARLSGLQEKYNKYGFEPKTLTFPEDSINVKYQTWKGRLAFRNINRTALGLSYSAEFLVDAFNDQLSNSESNSFLKLLLQKMVTKSFGVDLSVDASISRYKPEKKSDISNNFVSLAPALLYKTANINLQAGIRPSWDNGEFKVFPSVMAEFSSSDKRFSFQAGWIGYLKTASYQSIAGYNPWVWAPDRTYNARYEERYAGFKGSAGDHFSYSAKVAYNKINNQPLYVNDTMSGKSFLVLNEPELKVLNFGGEIGYNVGEQFSLISSIQFNQYKQQVNDKAWGLLPLEFNTTMRLMVLKDLYVNANLFAFDGPWSLTKNGRTNLQGAMDLSAGLEFKIVPNVKLWAQFNNILNKEYQRWNQYPTYGFNFLGGVVFSFAQKN
ncbi:MAG TPA: hypothetical protein VHK91_12760 [Flavisolibacter sp.]|jgi:hypothetical protein|nr:hypothetical protein [Flavisolibacter sp.]